MRTGPKSLGRSRSSRFGRLAALRRAQICMGPLETGAPPSAERGRMLPSLENYYCYSNPISGRHLPGPAPLGPASAASPSQARPSCCLFCIADHFLRPLTKTMIVVAKRRASVSGAAGSGCSWRRLGAARAKSFGKSSSWRRDDDEFWVLLGSRGACRRPSRAELGRTEPNWSHRQSARSRASLNRLRGAESEPRRARANVRVGPAHRMVDT